MGRKRATWIVVYATVHGGTGGVNLAVWPETGMCRLVSNAGYDGEAEVFSRGSARRFVQACEAIGSLRYGGEAVAAEVEGQVRALLEGRVADVEWSGENGSLSYFVDGR